MIPSMKFICDVVTFAILLVAGPTLGTSTQQGEANRPVSVASSGSVNTGVSGDDSQQAGQAVVLFLHWYKTHMQAVNRYPLVRQLPGKPYSVNLKNGEHYLAILKSSRLLTDGYLDQWRTYFRERNEGFRLKPQDEGPPDGFEYDLVMLTQDVDKQLAALKSLKINRVNVVKNRATVTLTLLGAYEFRLVHQNGQWRIDGILNLGQE